MTKVQAIYDLFMSTNKRYSCTDLKDMFDLKNWDRKVFVNTFGISVYAMHRKIRLENARQKLRNTDNSVKRIAIEAGYSSHYAFTEAYKNYFGHCPSKDRE